MCIDEEQLLMWRAGGIILHGVDEDYDGDGVDENHLEEEQPMTWEGWSLRGGGRTQWGRAGWRCRGSPGWYNGNGGNADYNADDNTDDHGDDNGDEYGGNRADDNVDDNADDNVDDNADDNVNDNADDNGDEKEDNDDDHLLSRVCWKVEDEDGEERNANAGND